MPTVLIPAIASVNFFEITTGGGGFDKFAHTTGNGNIGVSSDLKQRWANLYDISVLPMFITPDQIRELWDQEQAFNNAADSFLKGGYGIGGLFNPDTDGAEDGFGRCGLSGREYVETIDYRDGGSNSKDVDISSAQSFADLAAARASGTLWAVATQQVDEVYVDVDRLARVRGFASVSPPGPQLFVSYTEGAATPSITRREGLGRGLRRGLGRGL